MKLVFIKVEFNADSLKCYNTGRKVDKSQRYRLNYDKRFKIMIMKTGSFVISNGVLE